MPYSLLTLDSLLVNRANDRHGELDSEIAAIAWLFNHHEQQMKKLTRDLVSEGQVYEPPLVFKKGGKFIVFDGNRRVTCIKMLNDPKRAPTVDLQKFFQSQKAKWAGEFPKRLQCRVESNRDKIDEILYRRHTGSQGGVGQSNWDDRMKDTFVQRTGKSSGTNIADYIEGILSSARLLPAGKKIPRSTLNRLLSAEVFRSRVGITGKSGKFELTHQEPAVLIGLQKIADDLSSRRLVLGSIWDSEDKQKYLDRLEALGVLPKSAQAIASLASTANAPRKTTLRKKSLSKPVPRTTLIPQLDYGVSWSGRIHRHKSIWEELQFYLILEEHPNAISVLFRVLLELATDNYISQKSLSSVNSGDKLVQRIIKVGDDLHSSGKIDIKYLGFLRKLPQQDGIFSIDTLNRYVHSPNFAPSPQHLSALWDKISEFIVKCLNS